MASASRTVGIIGLGFGRGHIPAFQAHGCEVVAVCQRDQKVAREVAARYGVPQVFERWEQMLAEARPDIVVIASPPSLHRAIAVEALAAGAHVLCEKPLAMDAAEGRAMIEAAQRAKRTAMTSFNWRYPAAMQRLHTMAAAGFLGRVFHVNVRWLGDAGPTRRRLTWRMDRAQPTTPGRHGCPRDRPHSLSSASSSSKAQAGIAYPGRTVPGTSKIVDSQDFCSVTAELVSGAQVNMFTSRAARGTSEQTLEAYGTDGALQYRLDREKPRWWRGELRAAAKGSGFAPVKVPAGLPKSAGEGDPLEVTGKTTIAPLVKRFLAATRKGDSLAVL